MIRNSLLFIVVLIIPLFQSCNTENKTDLPRSTKSNTSASKQDSISLQDETKLIELVESNLSVRMYDNAVSALNKLNEIYVKKFDFPKAISTSKRILYYENKISDKILIAGTYNTIGLNYWRLGILDSAIYFLNKSVSIKKQIGDSLSLAKTYNNLGAVYWKNGDYGNYYKYTLLALTIRKKLKDIKGVVLGLNNVGLIYQRLKYYDMARESSLQALALADSINYTFGKEYSMKRLGALYLELRDLKKAEKYISQAMSILLQEDNKSGIAQIYNDLGRIQELKKDYAAAREYYDKSHNMSLEINDKFVQSFALMNKGHIDLIENKYASAIEEFNNARKLALSGHYTLILKEISLNLSSVYKVLGNKEKALLYLNEYLVLKDSLLNSALINSIGEMRIRYMIEESKDRQLFLQKEVETKNTTNLFLLISISILLITFCTIIFLYVRQRKLGQLLEKNNSEMVSVNETLKKKNIELTEANNTKHKLFSIIAHDLKNPFTSILGFAHLIKETSEDIGNEELTLFTDSLLTSSQSLVSLITNLTGWTLLQKNEIIVSPVIFNICKLTEGIIKELSLNAELKQVTITNMLKQSSEVYADTEMISTVIRNILANAIKFTPRESVIKVSGLKNDKFFELEISDSGIGMSQEMIDNILSGNKLSSGIGTANEKGTGLGLSISHDFIIKNNGYLSIKSELNKGSQFIISIPLQPN